MAGWLDAGGLLCSRCARGGRHPDRLSLPPCSAYSAATDRVLMHYSDQLVPVIETPAGLFETARIVASVRAVLGGEQHGCAPVVT